MGRRLKTHDRMKSWDVASSINVADLKCVFCSLHGDSHEHLFFECLFTSSLWDRVKIIANLQNSNSKWDDIVSLLVPLSNRNFLSNIIGRLALGATAYFVWQERNLRVHKKGSRSVDQVFHVIFETVRCKIMSLLFKETVGVKDQLARWKVVT